MRWLLTTAVVTVFLSVSALADSRFDPERVAAMYEFNETITYGPGDNETFWHKDGSGNGNDVDDTFNNVTPNTSVYKVGNSSWQGNGDYAFVNDQTTFPLFNNDTSFAVWFRFGQQPSNNQHFRIVGIGDNASGGKQLGLEYRSTGNTKNLAIEGIGFGSSYNIVLNTSTWYHAYVEYNKTTEVVRLFLNNENLHNFSSGPINFCGGDSDPNCYVTVGTWPWAMNSHWPGQLDDYRVFKKLLSRAQLANLYNNSYGNTNMNISVDGDELPVEDPFTVSIDGPNGSLDLSCDLA